MFKFGKNCTLNNICIHIQLNFLTEKYSQTWHLSTFLHTKNTSMETIFSHLNSYSVLKTTTRSHLTTNIPYIVVHRIGNPHSTQAAIGWRAVYILRVFCEHSWKGSFWTGFGRDGSLLWGVVGGATQGVPFQPSSLLLPHLNSRQLSFSLSHWEIVFWKCFLISQSLKCHVFFCGYN